MHAPTLAVAGPQALIKNGTLTKDRAIQVLDDAKAKSGAEYGSRASRPEEEALIDAVKKKLVA